jgi:hypothetical protein
LLNENFATVEKTAMERAKNESLTSEAVKQKSTWLNVRLLWGCDAWNVTPEQAAKQVVADLYEHLLRGGSVSVRVTGMDGEEHMLEVAARR